MGSIVSSSKKEETNYFHEEKLIINSIFVSLEAIAWHFDFYKSFID